MASGGLSASPAWRLVAPDGTVHHVRDHDSLKKLVRLATCECRPDQKCSCLFNVEHLLGIARGNTEKPEHVRGWRNLDRPGGVVWIRSLSLGRTVYLHGDSRVWCEATASTYPDMQFRWTNFRKLLNGTYRSNGKVRAAHG